MVLPRSLAPGSSVETHAPSGWSSLPAVAATGGGGLAAARRLRGWCATVEVWLTRDPEDLTGAAAHQLRILRALGLPIHAPEEDPVLGPGDLVLDALVGSSLDGPPSGRLAALIRAVNASAAAVLSLDLPSGLEVTSGTVFGSCVRADATPALALPKAGLWAPGAHGVTGELLLADIGVPEEVYVRLGLQVGPIFGQKENVHVG